MFWHIVKILSLSNIVLKNESEFEKELVSWKEIFKFAWKEIIELSESMLCGFSTF